MTDDPPDGWEPVVSSAIHSLRAEGEDLLVRFRARGRVPMAVYRYARGATHMASVRSAPSPNRHLLGLGLPCAREP